MEGARDYPFDLPSDLLRTLGLSRHPRRYVCLWWSCNDDDLSYDDGLNSGTGVLSDPWSWLDHILEPGIECWMLDNEINLGDVSEATHRMIIDTHSGAAYLATIEEARLVVQQQTMN